jgi:4-hydroxybenzoate polyprenyltransferase
MLRKISRLFVIKTPVEAYLIIFALALGAVERGSIYLTKYPGWGGKLLFLACTGAVFMAGAKILDCIKHEKRLAEQAEAVL